VNKIQINLNIQIIINEHLTRAFYQIKKKIINYLKKDGRLFVKIDTSDDKIPFLILLQAMGITKRKIYHTLYEGLPKNSKNFKTKPKNSTIDALFELNEILTGNSLSEKRIDDV
jgi:hypothetical protein